MRRSTRLLVVPAALALALLLAFSPAAHAGKPGGGGTSGGGGGGKKGGGANGGTGTISLVLVNSTDGTAHYGQTVTFNISTTATTEPWVNLKCWQGTAWIYNAWNGYFDTSLTGRDFILSGSSWSGGAADCTAYLTDPAHTVLGSTSFHVNA